MSMITERTVREVAVEVPNATKVFERFGIDYCCGGGHTLSYACAEKGLVVGDVLNAISAEATAEARRLSNKQNWNRSTLSDLIDHITGTHHAYVRQESTRIQKLLAKVSAKHGERHPEVITVQRVFTALATELSSHLMKEETILFPYIIELEQASLSGLRKPRPMFGSVKNPIRMMEIEHDSAGEALPRLRELSDNFTPPEDGCATFKATYSALQEFEADLHQHIHLENNILFPRAIALETSSPAR
jgi:regulator of cell morphogenesis and NO signaling